MNNIIFYTGVNFLPLIFFQGYSPVILYPKRSNSELMNRLVTQTTKMGIHYLDDSSLPDLSKDYSVIVDAIFGFSFRPPLKPPFDKILSLVAQTKVPVVSVDIPSGNEH